MPSLRLAALVGLIGVALVVLLRIGVATSFTDPFDAAVISVVRGPGLVGPLGVLRWVTELGSTAAVTVVAIGVLVLASVVGRWREGLAASLTILLASIGNELLKVAIARARPDLLDPIVVEHGYSFPSGHSVLSMVAYGVVAVLVARLSLPRAVRLVAVGLLALLVGLIGLSRVWLGVHFPTDVLAGWAAGIVVVALFSIVSRRVSPAPGGEAAGADPGPRRSDPPAAG
jgi:undecaprenyl-diphosphatase